MLFIIGSASTVMKKKVDSRIQTCINNGFHTNQRSIFVIVGDRSPYAIQKTKGDRRGRLLGNIVALGDIVRGRISPERVLEL